MNYFILIPFLSFFLHSLIITYVIAKNPKSKTNWAFAKFAGLIAMWALTDCIIWSLPADNTTLLLMRLQIIIWLPSAFMAFYFISIILKKKLGPVFFIYLFLTIIFALIGAFTNLIALDISKTDWGNILIPGQLYIFTLLFVNTSLIVYVVFLLISHYLKEKDPIMKKQLHYLCIGSIITYACVFFVNVILNAIFDIRSIPAFGTFLVLIQSIFISIAIVRYNFLTVGVKETANELFTQINDAVIIINQNGEVIEINNKAFDFFRIKEKKNLQYSDIFPDKYSYNDEYYNKEIELDNEKVVHYGLLSQSTLKEKKIVLGKLVIIKDVTLLRVREKEQIVLKEQVRQSQVVKMEAIGQLAGGIAHDFNNMLTAIAGYADLIERESNKYSEKLNKFSKRIITAIRRASDLTGKLLAFAGKGKHEMIPVDSHKVIMDVINLLKHSIDKRITITNELDAVDPVIKGDFTQIENAVLNIGINASDVMSGGGELIFKTENIHLDNEMLSELSPENKPGYYIKISISDTGCGINEEIKSRIFEPFFTTKDKGKGTGLGLASVYGTIKNHSGFIQLDSRINVGTTFHVFLPHSSESVIKRIEEKADLIESDIKWDRTVLVVDDEQLSLDIVTDMLSTLGFNIISKNNGYEGIDVYKEKQEHISFIVLDLNMPEISGYDCLKKFREINSEIKVILISGYYSDETVKKISEEKNLLFLKKPFSVKELTNTIIRIGKMS